MKKKWKRVVGILLSLCLLFTIVPIDGSLPGIVMAANGTLQNGELSENLDGWTSTGTYGYKFENGNLSLWDENAGLFSISQTVENMTAGDYVAKVAIVGNERAANPLKLTIRNNESQKEETASLIQNGWDDNWGTNNLIATKSVSVAEGQSVTVTISGEVPAGEWYGIKNVSLEASQAVKNAPITVQKVDGLSNDFIHGVDVSTYISEVQSGVKYYDENNNEKNLFEILKDAGVNYVRLRLWNCPYVIDVDGNYKYVDETGTEYKASQVAETKKKWIIEPQTSVSPDDPSYFEGAGYDEYFLANGTQVYREGYGAGNCGIENVTEMGKIATYYGMKVLLDFHYSDFWADPKKQSVPKAWKGMNLEQKTAALTEFTTDSINTLREAGVDVGMVQIGNEINNGMAGETSDENVFRLLKAGSAAVRAIDPGILVAVHYTDPQSESYQMGKADALDYYEVDYDVFASSFYPFWHGTAQTLTTNLKKIAEKYDKKVMVAEISYAWTYKDGDGYPDKVFEGASDMEFRYPVDAEGQAAAVRDAIAAVAAIGDKGIGTFYWEPAWVPPTEYVEGAANAETVLEANMKAWRLYGSGWGSIYAKETDPEIKDDMNGSEWNNQALFDFSGKALPSINVYKWVYTGAEGPTRVSTIDTASCEMGYKQTPKLPQSVRANLNDGTSMDVPVTWDAAQVEKLKTAIFGEYTINGSIGAFSYTNAGDGSVINVAANTWKTTCLVNISGKNYVTNGSFEENDGKNATGWTLTNYMEVNDYNNAFIDKPNSANAKSGSYYYTGWAEVGKDIDFKVEQTISTVLPAGLYTLYAWYQGTSVGAVKDTAGLYAIVTYKDGSVKNYKTKIQINNVWKDFYQATITDIPVDGNVKSVVVGSRLACSGAAGLAPWVVVDDISLMRQGDLPASDISQSKNYHITFDVNGGKQLSVRSKIVTYNQKYGTLPTPKRAGYTFSGWYTAKTKGTKVTANSIVKITKNQTLYAQWKKVTKPAKVKKPKVKNSAKKSMKVTFKKVKGANGYQISYSTSRKFKKGTVKKTTSDKLSKTVKKLKKGKTYYVRVCAYKKDSMGRKIYGANSATVKVKIKK